MELSGETLSLSRVPSALDEAVIAFTEELAAVGVDYVLVSGYVVILTGRSRSTEDVNVILEPLSQAEIDELVTGLKEHGYLGMAMPLDELDAMLHQGERFRIAKEGELFPNFEVWFASKAVERTALEHSLTADLGENQLEISPLELQLAFKLRLAQQAESPEGRDFEDALHLYLTFGERLKADALERYVDELGVQDYYAELQRV